MTHLHDATNPNCTHYQENGTPQANAPTSSRRRRLWELTHACHCPVVGVCIPLDTLRRLVNKALGGKALADDYEVHVGAVAECAHRNRLSEALQDELERRYVQEVRHFKSAKTVQALAALWSQAIRQGDVAGAFWAALVHPRCDAVMQEVLCRDMHMLQHQAGANARIDVARFSAVLDENAVLTRELGRTQERSTRWLAEKSADIARLTMLNMRLHADNIAKESRIVFLLDDLAALKASNAALDANARLQKKLDQLAARQEELEAQNTSLRQKLARSARALDALNTEPLAVAQSAPLRVSPVTLHLNQKTVLCVGGRTGNIANYRDLIERVGGRFAHHDGGLEDNQSVLDASLAAADLVICQTGCISHNAYWKVKDFCKRTGKRCVFVENPSTSSLVRGLEQITEQNTSVQNIGVDKISL